jgi:hypothetical protein
MDNVQKHIFTNVPSSQTLDLIKKGCFANDVDDDDAEQGGKFALIFV